MPSLTEYEAELYGPLDELLTALPAEAESEGIPAIHIPDEVGRLLQVLIRSAGVKSILELGTLFGYSSIWMARALPADGRVISLEFDAKHAEISRRNHDRAGLKDKIVVREGAALDSLPDFAGHIYDLIFIDADKVNYPNYLDWALKLTQKGGLIVADNVWRRGEVTTGADENASAMAEFNRRIVENDRLTSTIVPTRDAGDGVMVAVVK